MKTIPPFRLLRLTPRGWLVGSVALLSLVSWVSASHATDWLQFRGTDHQANANGIDLPVDLDAEKNLAWKVDLPARGPAGPIIVGDRVIVCSSGGEGREQDRVHVNCYSTKTGGELWHRQFWATGRPYSHPTSANAAPTPASDGERIYCFFSSNDLICLDLEGRLQWYRGLTYDFPKAANDVGMSSSPTLAGDTVVVQIENQGDSFVAGLDKLTGETRWRQDRPQSAAWASPVAYELEGQAYVVVLSRDRVTSYQADTGEIAWEIEGQGSSVSSPTPLAGNRMLIPFNGMSLVSLGPESAEVVWEDQRLGPRNVSPIIDGDEAFFFTSGGVLSGCRLEDGDRTLKFRMEGSFWSTPIIANGYVYAVSEQGVLIVARLGDDPEVITEFSLGEPALASPAVSDDGLFVRSETTLWKFALE